jgi:predicted nucleic acid-binding protein
LKIYFDTGLLLKLYSFEPNSAQAIALIQSHGTPIILSGLQQTELRNALHRKRARGEMTPAQLKKALKDLQRDLDGGVLQTPRLDWPEVWAKADRLTAKCVPATSCRTLDVLHVAVALQLGVKIFGTADQRQLLLARKAGLKTVTLSETTAKHIF